MFTIRLEKRKKKVLQINEMHVNLLGFSLEIKKKKKKAQQTSHMDHVNSVASVYIAPPGESDGHAFMGYL